MSMVYCRACGHQIDEEAAFCQKCGAPQNLTLTSQVASIPSPHSLFLNQFFPISDFLFSSKGRISRIGFIISVLVFLLAAGFVGAISAAIGEAFQSVVLAMLFPVLCFPFLIRFLVVSIVKRFHDMGMSGIYFFFCLITIIGFIPFFALIFRGSENDNDYGPSLLKAQSFGDVKPTIEQPIPNSSLLNISTPDVINEPTQNAQSECSDSQQQATNQAIHTSPSQPNCGDDTNPLTDHQEQGKNWIFILSVTFVAILFFGGTGWYKYHQFKAQAALTSLETISLADAISEIDGYARQCDDTPASHDLCARQEALSNLIENKYRYCWGSSESRDASESMKHWIPCDTDLTQDRFKLKADNFNEGNTPLVQSSSDINWATTFKNWENGCENYYNNPLYSFNTVDDRIVDLKINEPFKSVIGNPAIKYMDGGSVEITTPILKGDYYGIPFKSYKESFVMASEGGVSELLLNMPLEQVKEILKNKQIIYRNVHHEDSDENYQAKLSADENDSRLTKVSCF